MENTTIEKKPFDVSSSLAFFYALLIHTLLLFLVLPVLGYQVNYDTCIKLLTGAKSLPEASSKEIEANLGIIFCYFCSTFVLAFAFGKLSQTLMFKLNPYKSSRFAFDTPWYYELKGKLSETQDAQLIKVSCLVDIKSTSFLYYGVLEDFYLDSNGQLNRIVLSGVMRRPIESDEEVTSRNPVLAAAIKKFAAASEIEALPPSSRFYDVKGDRLILKYEDIKNINIEYLYIQEET